MTVAIPSYDALYSISDLHLGGPPGMQMFRESGRLGGFLTWLAGSGPGARHCALVIAGDVIDSLPSLTRAGGYIMVECAADLVESTLKAFPEVLEGLRTFVRAEGRELVVLLGNHDLELALAEAQYKFCELVAEKDEKAWGRIHFYTNGTGFRCRVGSKIVYITHGNEADPWNHVDYEALRRAAHLRSLGHAFDLAAWRPNAGTMLVVEAMNDIKRRYPFVDLLKPETGAALKALAVLDEKRMADFYAAIPALVQAAIAHTGPRVVLGGSRQAVPTPDALELLRTSEASLGGDTHASAEEFKKRVLKLHREGKRPEDLVGPGVEKLNVITRLWSFLRDKPADAMRNALREWTKGDESFSFENEDDVCRGVLSQIGTGIDVVITGHTHLPRWIHPSGDFCRVYLNAGTWARLIAFDADLLDIKNKEAFAAAFEALKSPDINVIDKHEVRLLSGTRPLVLDATLAARVVASDAVAPGLVRVRGDRTTVTVDAVDPKSNILRWPQ